MRTHTLADLTREVQRAIQHHFDGTPPTRIYINPVDIARFRREDPSFGAVEWRVPSANYADPIGLAVLPGPTWLPVGRFMLAPRDVSVDEMIERGEE